MLPSYGSVPLPYSCHLYNRSSRAVSRINLHNVVHVGLSEIISCSCHVTRYPHLSLIVFILGIIETSATCIKSPFRRIKIAAKSAITPTNQPRIFPSYGSVPLLYSCHLYDQSSHAVLRINLHVVVHVRLSEIITCSCHVTRFFVRIPTNASDLFTHFLSVYTHIVTH